MYWTDQKRKLISFIFCRLILLKLKVRFVQLLSASRLVIPDEDVAIQSYESISSYVYELNNSVDCAL